MRNIEQAPTSPRETAGAKFVVTYKGKKISLSKLQFELFITLTNGHKHSSHKLMQRLHTSDPRKEVQYLRKKGIHVCDEWVAATPRIARHKLYWIDSVDV